MLGEHLLRFDKNASFCFIDFETENLCLHLKYNCPWQVAMLKVVNNNIIDDYVKYIRWDRPPNVSKQAALITRFNIDNILQKGTGYSEVVKTVVEWTKNTDWIIGHNVLGFDIYFLFAFYQMVGENPYSIPEKIIDTHAIAKGIKLQRPFKKEICSFQEYQYKMIHTIGKGIKTSTKFLGNEYGIEHDYENLHDAMNDILLTKKIWDKLKYQIEI